MKASPGAVLNIFGGGLITFLIDYQQGNHQNYELLLVKSKIPGNWCNTEHIWWKYCNFFKQYGELSS